MRPSDQFFKVVRIVRLACVICGVDVNDENYKMNWITYLVMIFITGYFMCLVYTIYLKIFISLTNVLESVCMVGSAFQGTAKFASGLIYGKQFKAQFDLLTEIYLQYEAKGMNYSLALKRCISQVRVVFIIAACLYMMSFSSLACVPIFFYLYSGQRFLPMQFNIPLLDTDTNFGYFSTFGIHWICLLFGAAGNFAMDMAILLYFAHSTMFADIFKLKADELNELAIIDSRSQKTMDKLKDIIKWHQTYSNFIGENNIFLFWTNFVQITTSGLSIVLTLVIMFISDWPGSYVYIWLAFAMMYLYCGMGTVVEIVNDRFTDEIYAIHWYLLTVPQQKAIRIMLMSSQSPNQITVGSVAPLSVSTGLQVTKSVYSVFMMLLNFLG